MPKRRLLLADNDQKFLETRKELLEREGYQVYTASSPREARQVLQDQQPIDLALLDLRLEDDDDDRDVSGFILARDSAPVVPKIILTAFETLEMVRLALRPGPHGSRIAVDFIAKEEEPIELLKAVERALLRNVFVAHGRDNALRLAVEQFLEHRGLQPIVAMQQPKAGRTPLGVLEHCVRTASFAVVLLTPDDRGRLQGELEEEQRARQNVIFELGYLLGTLGPQKVCVLHQGPTKIFSDYEGVLRILVDNGDGWKMELMHELRNAGLNVDPSRVA